MKTYIADIIPRIQGFSQRLDDLTKLTNQHWVSLGDINQSKKVFIFRANNQLLISENGIFERGSWKYLGNQSLLLDIKSEKSYLLKHGFFEENVIALKLDSTESYAFSVNEIKNQGELNFVEDVLTFWGNKYLKYQKTTVGIGTKRGEIIDDNPEYSYKVVDRKEKFDVLLGNFTQFEIRYHDSRGGEIFKGSSSVKKFYMHLVYGKKYFDDFE